MELSSSSFANICLLSCLLVITCDFATAQPLCHAEERSALLQFKQSFVIDKSSCSGTTLILSSWEVEEGGNGNCCSWDGIECNNNTGYVVGLDLSNSCLYGSIDSNSTLFQLVHLQKLNLSYNNFNFSNIPSRIGQLSELRYLNLSSSELFGQIPYSISKLYKLSVLDLADYSHESLLEVKNPDLSTLLVNLTSLEVLNLVGVDISSHVPNFLVNFSSLRSLCMEHCNLLGEFPEKIFQLQTLELISVANNPSLYGYLPEFNSSSFLKKISLSDTGFYGELPISIGNLFFLNMLILTKCNFSGLIPFSISNLTELRVLDMTHNYFNGPIPSFESLTKLEILGLSSDYPNATTLSWLPKLSKLRVLSLLGLKLHSSTESSLGNLTKLVLLDLSINQMSGHFPPSIHNLSSLKVLIMNNNDMTGTLPAWLGNFSTSLQILNLANNTFEGSLPDTFGKQMNLASIDLSNNLLQGKVPRSLSNCQMLQVIDLGRNQLNDVFPSWLRTLPNLRVLVLRSNQLYGAIGEPKTSFEFPKLHIIDLSHNYFSHNLPSTYISNWNSMKTFSSHAQYIQVDFRIAENIEFKMIYFYRMTVTNKRLETIFGKILDDLSLIDLSSNRFDGQIPDSIGNLRGLKSLNLSFNMLSGEIPSSLGNLAQIEALDLSHNKLSGNMPQQLSQLNFLAIFDVSYNKLSGAVPRGKQFDVMDRSAYEGNPGLCGNPLPNKCENSMVKKEPFSTSEEEEDGGMSFFRFGWKEVLIGYGSGTVFGMVIGHFIFTWKENWFLKTFRIAPKGRRGRRVRR